jgi:hypothetical protein
MALPTVDRPGCEQLPIGHSIDAHLNAERIALIAEWQSAERTSRGDRWMMLRAAGLGLALAGTIALGWRQTHLAEDAPNACPPAEAAAPADAAGC